MIDPEKYAKLKASGRLPSPKGVALSIVRLLQGDDYQLEDLVRMVQTDPAIAGRILKYSNVAAYGSGRPIVSLSKAVLTIGANRIRDLVLGFSVLHDNRDGIPGFDFQKFWGRALATAIASQSLASHAKAIAAKP